MAYFWVVVGDVSSLSCLLNVIVRHPAKAGSENRGTDTDMNWAVSFLDFIENSPSQG